MILEPNKKTNHENDAKTDPKYRKIHSNKISDERRKISPKILETFRGWFPIWSHLSGTLIFLRVFSTCFSKALGYPFGPMLASSGAPLVRFALLFGRS